MRDGHGICQWAERILTGNRVTWQTEERVFQCLAVEEKIPGSL